MESEIIARVTNWEIFQFTNGIVHFFLSLFLSFSLSLSRNRFLTLLKTRPGQIHLSTRLSVRATHPLTNW